MDEATGIEGATLEDLNGDPKTLELLTILVANLVVNIVDGEFLLRAAVRETDKKA